MLQKLETNTPARRRKKGEESSEALAGSCSHAEHRVV